MNATWKKVFGDIREAPARMAMVALAVCVGTAAMGTGFGAAAVLTREVESSYLGTNPPSATLWLDPADARAVRLARTHPAVTAAESWRLVRARVEVAPGEWRPLRLYAVGDYRDLRVSKFTPVEGDWPPLDGEVLVERTALPVLGVGRGGNVRVRLPGGTVADLRVGGVVHDPGQAPGWVDQVAYAYCTPGTLRRLGLGGDLNELRVVVAGDRDRASAVAGEVAERLRAAGRPVNRVEVPLREHPHADHMGAMLTVLRVFSVLALVLSGAAAANVTMALMRGQVRQVGVMKTVGATSGQVASVYLRLVLLLALPAVAVGLGAGAWASGLAADLLAENLNLAVADGRVPAWLLVAEGFAGVGVPLAATGIGVWRAARMTAREAISHAGVQPPGRVRVGWLSGWSFTDRITALGLRNTFRRPGRLAVTTGTLALGGAVIMTAANVYAGLTAGLDATTAAHGHDIDVRLSHPAPAQELARQAEAVRGVTGVEAWGMTLAALEPAGGGPTVAGTGRYTLFAPPQGTRFLGVPVVAGRWYEPDEADAVVVNRTLADKEPLLRPGGEVVLVAEGRRRAVRVVGVVEEIAPPTLYADAATLAALTGQAGTAAALRVTTEAGAERAVAGELEEVLAASGHLPTLVMTRTEFRTSLLDHFQMVVVCLIAAGLAAVAVGGLNTATSMGLSVLERSREIGVARAVGATRGIILRMLATEGLALSALGFGVAFLVALPMSVLLTGVIGRIGPHVTLPFVVSWPAVGGWAVAACVITLTATLLPARRAVRLPVRDVLAHE